MPPKQAGELSYESDAAERLRSELRAVQAEGHSLRNDLDAAKLAHLRLQEAAYAAEAAAAAAAQQLEAQREGEGVLQVGRLGWGWAGLGRPGDVAGGRLDVSLHMRASAVG